VFPLATSCPRMCRVMQAVPQRQPRPHQPYESDINRLVEHAVLGPQTENTAVYPFSAEECCEADGSLLSR
jgi:hypothetical protein